MNKNLGRKTYDDRDEFYSTRETAERLLCYISDKHLKGKVVYCNCDGPESEIYKLLKERFSLYGLKLLIATKYVHGGNGIKTTFDGTIESIEQLSGDGSYSSEECEQLLSTSDVVVTNPPFSKLNDYIPFVMQHNVDVILIVNMMSLMYKNVLPYTLALKFRFIDRFSGGATFKRPDGITHVNVIGITTLNDAIAAHITWNKYTVEQLKAKGKFIFADGTQTLELQFTRYIPIDYDGEMYVPTSILLNTRCNKWFDIVRLAKEQVKVNGKGRFYRVVIKRKQGITAQDILNEDNN